MSFLSKWLAKKSNASPDPEVAIGRYTDAFKTPEQLEAWNRSLMLFDQGKRKESYLSFLNYLRDPREDNVHWADETGGVTKFWFFQGSAIVEGYFDRHRLRAESRIALAPEPRIGLMRRLLEINFTLRYCRFALTPNRELALCFDTFTADGSPFKILHALRELAIHADKQDDLLLDEHDGLQRLAATPIAPLPDEEKAAKYAFLVREIDHALALLNAAKPDPVVYPNAYAFLLLSLAFRLDHLIKPEGFLMDVIERIYNIFFSKTNDNNNSPSARVQAIAAEFRKIRERPREDLYREMYRTRSTFGLSPAANHDSVSDMITRELPNMDWALKNGYDELALAVPRYIAGLALFQIVPPRPTHELLRLFFQITEAPYFRELGFRQSLTQPNGLPDKAAIGQALKSLIAKHKAQYPHLSLNPQALNYVSMPLFAQSYMQALRTLNLRTDP